MWRRSLRRCCTLSQRRLSQASREELRVELAEFADAVAPLPPTGWTTHHKPGTNVVISLCDKPRAGTALGYSLLSLAYFEMKDPSLLAPHLNTCEYVPFTVRIAREGLATDLWCRIASVNSSMQVTGIMTAPRLNLIVPTDPHALTTIVSNLDDTRYSGPKFRSLDKELRTQVKHFLEELGVSDSFGEYVAQATYFCENEEYQRWLGRLSHFSDPPLKS